jgi:hypothetical protein
MATIKKEWREYFNFLIEKLTQVLSLDNLIYDHLEHMLYHTSPPQKLIKLKLEYQLLQSAKKATKHIPHSACCFPKGTNV